MASALTDGASSIQVAVRVRPFTIREAAQLTKLDDGPLFLGDGSLAAVPAAPRMGQKGIRNVIKVVDERCLVFDPPDDSPVQRFSRSFVPTGKRVKDQTFGFDRVFDENAAQADIYEATTRTLLDSVLDGYNATVFAYGATGCGKTHTITGTAQQPGIIFLTMQELFEKVEELQETKDVEVSLSYLEIYNETIRDLLNAGSGGKQGLMLREDSHQAVSVAGLTSHKPRNVQEVMDVVIQGNANRTQSPTEANATSSRSHAVLQVNISMKDRDSACVEPVTMATLSIIDLAGSERASATKNRGERLLEGANINKSLLALGSCINALCDPKKKNHVPYRNSKLTRLLKFSLGGNCRTVMIVCVSPSSQHFDETQNTLRYANRAKNIQTKSVRNVYNVDRHVKDYLKKIDEQMARINELTAQQKQYEELAFAKFRKVESKRGEVAHEGVQRIRTAYENSTDLRRERTNDTKRLRQIERRIGAISGWIGAFDQLCETRDEEEPPIALAGMRKTAQGILVELEGSRQYYHQRLAKNNWSRAIDTALQDGIRQLRALDGSVPDGAEEATLQQEIELLKSRADVEIHLSVLEQERVGEAALMHVMLSAHFETIAILNQILQMDEEEAVDAGRTVLGKLLHSCTEVTGQVIKPDGGLQIMEAVPPTKFGTPKKRKQIPLLGPDPMKNKIRHSFAGLASALPAHVVAEQSMSPVRRMSSPRRIKMGGARKGVSFGASPKKRSPGKKRAVRWRDDTEDGGSLVEFQPTPQKFESSPTHADDDTDELPAIPSLPASLNADQESSPLPNPPAFSVEPRKPGTGRFAAGFLSKKASDLSPPLAPPVSSFASLSSEDETSPLRELTPNSTTMRSPLSQVQHNEHRSSGAEAKENQYESSDDLSLANSSSDLEKSFTADKETAGKIRSAIRRRSSIAVSKRDSIHRRRSPTASAALVSTSHFSSSPPSSDAAGSIFSASHARRMVKSERDETPVRSVLAPRSTPVTKGAGPVPVRRSMTDASLSSTLARDTMAAKGPVRLSNVVPGSARGVSKAAWR